MIISIILVGLLAIRINTEVIYTNQTLVDKATQTPPEEEHSSLVCSLCNHICSSSDSAKATTPSTTTPGTTDELLHQLELIASTKLRSNSSNVARNSNWPPPLPTGIPHDAPLTILAILTEAEEDSDLYETDTEYTITTFSSVDKRATRTYFVNFSKYGGETQAIEALKAKDPRLYMKINTLLYEFMAAYEKLTPDGRAFLDGAIGFFKPAVKAELNIGLEGSSGKNGTKVGPTLEELEKQELALLDQFKAMSATSKFLMKEHFPAIFKAANSEIDRLHSKESSSIEITVPIKPRKNQTSSITSSSKNTSPHSDVIFAGEAAEPPTKDDGPLDVRDVLAMLGLVASADDNEKTVQEE